MMQVPQISESELVLMRIIWAHGGTALYAQVMDALEVQGLDWKKNTVLTFLSRLVEKGMLRAGKVGRRNEYTALVEEKDYQAEQTLQLVRKVYGGDVKGLVNTLVQGAMVSGADADALRQFWEGGGQDG